jgi:predicted solute-binding protein
METITITVTNDRLTKLKEVAADFDVTLEELVRLSIENLLLQPEAAFQRAMKYALDKNRELYRRLACWSKR